MMAAFNPVPTVPNNAFASPQNRSGLFRPPSQATTLPPTVPNALTSTSDFLGAAQPQSTALPATTIAPLPSFANNPLMQPSSASLPPTAVNAKPDLAPEDPFRGLDTFGDLAGSRRPQGGPTPPPKSASTHAPPHAPTHDPFSARPGLGATPTPMPSTPSGLPRTSSDPFSNAGTVGATPRALAGPDPFGFGAPAAPPPPRAPTPGLSKADPFAGLGAPAPDPFAGLAPARTPTKDPFAGLATTSPPVPDPFAAAAFPASSHGSSPSAFPGSSHGSSPSAFPGSSHGSSPSAFPPSTSPPSPSAFPDPFSSTEPFDPQSLFGAGASSLPSASSSSPPPPPQAEPMSDPFGASSAPPSPANGALSAGGMDGFDASPANDPFDGLEDVSADVTVDESGEPPPEPSPGMVAAPASAVRRDVAPASNSATFASPPPTTGADMRKLRRLETSQRVREVAWAAAQIVLLVAFIAVAVIVARGGRLEDVMKGDVRAALGGPRAHVARRRRRARRAPHSAVGHRCRRRHRRRRQQRASSACRARRRSLRRRAVVVGLGMVVDRRRRRRRLARRTRRGTALAARAEVAGRATRRSRALRRRRARAGRGVEGELRGHLREMTEESLFDQAAPLVVDKLGKALLAVPKGQLRAVYLEERLKDAPALPLVRALACAQREAVRGFAPARALVETFGELVRDDKLDKQLRGALVTGALMVGEDAVIPLVDKPAANDADAGSKGDKAKRGSLADAGETLGRRKSLARTATGDTLLKILDDPHPDVIKNVLLNPKLTESLAVRVAARRPIPPAVLEVVAKSRFSNRNAVRRAIVLNPDCPPKLAVRLIATMTAADLSDVAQDSSLSSEVRNAAKLLLK
jgi:hypothetical protein